MIQLPKLIHEGFVVTFYQGEEKETRVSLAKNNKVVSDKLVFGDHLDSVLIKLWAAWSAP